MVRPAAKGGAAFLSDFTTLLSLRHGLAPWCGPCRMLGPVVQRVADEAQGRWQVGKVNVDEQPELARQFGIMSIPTVMVFKNGALHAQAVGVQTQQKLEEMLQNAL